MGELTLQLLDAFGIMLLGMGLVYLFLSLLILGIHLVAKWCAKDVALDSHSKELQKIKQSTLPLSVAPLDPKVVAAITLAVRQYRSQIE
ncbi:OadG family protein [Shewanella putrefaciens]|uniref:OadG family protein n=1 Tax=Shewanella putrefaciens TaxID=24 RepID=UPI00285F6A02|nr:OadG family transporter subunit [Shewanella putrefaciens]MDR6963091.1 oxaloacetate decarboxylase gamma subunit [Shewanella putrefaciens]